MSRVMYEVTLRGEYESEHEDEVAVTRCFLDECDGTWSGTLELIDWDVIHVEPKKDGE